MIVHHVVHQNEFAAPMRARCVLEIRHEGLLALAAVLIECPRLAIGNHCPALLSESANLARFRRRKCARSRQNQHAIAVLDEFSLLNLPVCHKVVLQTKILNQPAPGLAQAQKMVVDTFIRGRTPQRPGIAFRFLRQHPFGAHTGLRIMDGDGIRQPRAIDEQGTQAARDLAVIRRNFTPAVSQRSVLSHEFVLVVPDDQAAIAVQQLVPHAMFFPRAVRECSGHDGDTRVDGAQDLDVIADIVWLDGRERLRKAIVIVAAPARHLTARDSGISIGIGRAHRIDPHLKGARICDVHPLFEVGPGGIVVIGALHGLVRGRGHDGVPIIEVGFPLLIKRG